jgi:hypothetical protein
MLRSRALCYAFGDAVLRVLDGTRWGQRGMGGLVANRSWPIGSAACDRIGAITHPLTRHGSARELVSAFCPLEDTLKPLELGAGPVHEDGEPPRDGDTRLSHR